MYSKVFSFTNCFLWNFSFFCLINLARSQVVDQAIGIALNTVDVICSSTMPLHNAFNRDKPNINKMNFVHITACQNYSVPLIDAKKFGKYKKFDRKKKLVILAAGWLNTINNSDTLNAMWRAFTCRNDVNFLYADVASYMNTDYKSAALNTIEVGKSIAIGLKNLIQIVPLRNIHLIGHSLGAHTIAVAGRWFTTITNGLRIPRITGLDPAKPCFTTFDNNLYALNRNDATFIDIIHTNNNVLGLGIPIGHMDFYPGGIKYQQPGCDTVDCSHSRAVHYFVESIYPKYESNFPAYKCRNINDLHARNCTLNIRKKSYMGYRLGNRNLGIFYVNVSDKSPFGTNRMPAKNTICRRCRRR